jgi:hypothetical protein
MPGFWESRETAKTEGLEGTLRSVDWRSKFEAIDRRIGDYAWRAGQWRYQPKTPSYTGEVIFRQQFTGDTSYYSVEGEGAEEPVQQAADYREGQSWITWYSGGGEQHGRYREPDVLREIKITYWIKSDEQVDIGIIRNWLDSACQAAFRGGSSLDEVESWHGASNHYEVYEGATGQVQPMISSYAYENVFWEYWNRQKRFRINGGAFHK